jgi:hypothetical protein
MAEDNVSLISVDGSRPSEKEVNNEPDWYLDGDKWVKIFLEPDGAVRAGDVTPGKFKQFDYIYNVPGENEFPREKWNSKECRDGFHITLRKDVWFHLSLHDYKSVYIAEVVSHGDEFYDNRDGYKRKVRVVTFGPAVPLADVLGKHADDFTSGQMLRWSVANNHLDLVKLTLSEETEKNFYYYGRSFYFALERGNAQIADFLIENCENDDKRIDMLFSAIQHGCVDLVKRLIENISVKVSYFQAACERGQFEIFQLLRAKYGEPKCSDIIDDALCGGNVEILNYIKSRGVDMSDFGLFVYACMDDSNVKTIEYLVSEGADVKHPLIAFLARGYTRKEVREYLLAQIENKSEVPWCEGLEREINEISKSFSKRIYEGDF